MARIEVRVIEDPPINVRNLQEDDPDVQVYGDQIPGLDGVGITSVIMNPDYTITIGFSNGQSYTTPPVRGETGATGSTGPQGPEGPSGKDGKDGADGHTPVITSTKSDGTTTVYSDGVPVATILDGEDGSDGDDGADGITFTPSVDEYGVISWTNDGGKTNPTPRSIKGDKGDTGGTGAPGPNTVTTSTTTNLAGILKGDGSNVGTATVDASPSEDSTNLVESGGVYSALANKLNTTATAKRSMGALVGTFDDGCTASAYSATVPGVTELYDGLLIFLTNIPIRTGSSGSATLDVNGLGAKNLTVTGGGPTRYYSMLVDSDYFYIYLTSNDSWNIVVGGNTNDNTIAYYDRYTSTGSNPTVKSTVYRYMIGGFDRDGKCIPFTSTSNKPSANTKDVTTEAFDPQRGLWYYNSTTMVSAGSRISQSYYSIGFRGSAYWSYTFNIYSGQNVTADKDYYLVCDPQADGTLKLHAMGGTLPPLTDTLPTTQDNLVYMFLGHSIDGTHGTIELLHPCGWHDGTRVRPWYG